MKINSQNPLSRPTPATPRDDTPKAKDSDKANQQSGGPSATTHLRQATTDASRDIDTVKVEEIRDAIREGRLEIHAERIADALIESLQQTTGSDNA
ncbi:flagellar biosynthesis anti-sigma factor FlgM [Halomonas campisalis]|uniref:Negative regulator of flagellin synthesis n=1 Tax=Billgrantia campisalis TaxID=74661 RepID=A0ABS9P3C0_9GAMM|nr:flagellar biosynthesis anti-sigma factor FlgM [Halomonas campisalis]MCG6656269.1 flagellar biosynthesis anti-sigma factor FlgM [Halomonas campisalis]MDR5861456.1 flagellar biosynthesis anti-sigma factor FlgM [Halomonas campisalis]